MLSAGRRTCRMTGRFPQPFLLSVTQLLAIAAGGAIGAVARYGLSSGIYQWLGRGFPYGTLAVNVIGSFLMGLMFVLLSERIQIPLEARALVLVGFLGAFTTFSTFSIESLQLIEQGEALKAGLNMLLSVASCMLAVWLGVVMGRSL